MSSLFPVPTPQAPQVWHLVLLATSCFSADLLSLVLGSLECFKGLVVVGRKCCTNPHVVLKVVAVVAVAAAAAAAFLFHPPPPFFSSCWWESAIRKGVTFVQV